MSLDDFKALVKEESYDVDDPILKSLILIKQGKWEDSHNIAQDIDNKWGSLLHGYLHRIEGDQWNAAYWYKKAGEEDFLGTLEDEWDFIAAKYLSTLIN